MKSLEVVDEAPRGSPRGATLAAVVLALTPCCEGSTSRADTGSEVAWVSAAAGPGPSLPRPGEAVVTLRCDAAPRAISPWIYGIGVQPQRDTASQWALGATVRRWGGNHTTRYNWQLGNAWNTGKDWYFKNVDYDASPRPAHQRFIDDGAAHGLATFMTVPIIGWVAKDTISYGFPVSVFGAQQRAEPGVSDVGSGVSPAGRLLAPGPPERTSVPMPPEVVGQWVRSNRARDLPGKRGVVAYFLDNEPTLWSETHRDVHPAPVSYDELLARTLAYASAIRAADPGALIAGPALWGWTALFGSGVDKAAHPAHPDRDAHGGVPLLPWWLGEVAAEEARTGVRLLDLVDVHFYPQGPGIGVGLLGGTDPDTAARRIRSTRALWDPTYEDESWIDDEVRLLPRLTQWIAERRPGLGISIGEYNFGAEAHMSGGLAVAEALGRFGALGVTSAFYWDHPPPGSPAARAFDAYRNYDGAGGHFLDLSVPASSSRPLVSAFASRDASREHMVVVLLGLDPRAAHEARLDASTCGRLVARKTYAFAGEGAGFRPTQPTPGSSAGAEIGVFVPPYSMTVLELSFATALPEGATP